jgi:hypothetical protein
MSDVVARTPVMASPVFSPPEGSRHKENKSAMSSEPPLQYIHGDNKYRSQTEETETECFPISREWQIFTARVAGSNLTLLSRLLRHACQVTFLLFFVLR